MKNKKRAVNVLMTEEVDDGIKLVANSLGISKSRTIRFMCMEYLTRAEILSTHDANTFQHL